MLDFLIKKVLDFICEMSYNIIVRKQRRNKMVAMEMTKTFFELSKNEILNGIGERYIITHYDGWELVYFDKTSEKKQVIRLVKND